MTAFGTILEAQTRAQQLDFNKLIAEIEVEESEPGAPISPETGTTLPGQWPISPEIGPEPHQVGVILAEIGTETHPSTGSGQANGNGFPSGWMYQMSIADSKRDFAEVLADVKAVYQRKFGCKPKTIWANPSTSLRAGPATGDGDHVNHDKRIGRGYLLLGPLPRTS